MNYRILVAEDDRGLNQGIRLALKEEGTEFVWAYTLKDAKAVWQTMQPDMILLDVNFPDGSGFDFLHDLRQASDIPVLLITANDLESDEVTGLTLGADDYITKPFGLMALRARVDNIRRRFKKPAKQIYEDGVYRFDFEKLEFYADGIEIQLSVPEQKLLKLFAAHPGQTLTRGQLIDKIWTDGMEYVDENALSVTISRLRKKLSVRGRKNPIRTVYGIGYCWKVLEEQACLGQIK